MKGSLWLIGLVVSGWVALVGCDAADRAFDCQSVCSRWKDCFDPNYDVSKCRDTCRAKAANDAEYEAKADACEACIGNRSCIGSVANCTTVCAGIVVN